MLNCMDLGALYLVCRFNNILEKTNEKGEEMSKDEYISQLEDLIKYQFGYNLLMKYWDYLPDNEKDTINEELQELGL